MIANGTHEAFAFVNMVIVALINKVSALSIFLEIASTTIPIYKTSSLCLLDRQPRISIGILSRVIPAGARCQPNR